MMSTLQAIPCPYCAAADYGLWAEERGFHAVRCQKCSLIYVNPRPAPSLIDSAVRTGRHGKEAQHLDVTIRRSPAKVRHYYRVLRSLFDDVWQSRRNISWLDVGAGYGEVLEALSMLAPPGSHIEGLEPMHAKASHARDRGLNVSEEYFHPSHPKVDFVSLVNVFSHMPDFRAFLLELRQVLKPNGELFLETGNLADLASRNEFSGALGLPDHLVFAGWVHIRGYLEDEGFEIVRVHTKRVDGVVNLAKNTVKKIIGRPVLLRVPYTSNHRQFLIRARLSDQKRDRV